jgi:2-polyprenyl-6-methoxyphenol hydroxylase-like FAD-dependent oxidoreductase
VTAGDPPSYDEVDPFDLPEWLGEAEVTWESGSGLASGHRVEGWLTALGQEPVPCDLLAVDDAYPAPVAADPVRVRAHQLWRHGEVLVVSDAGHLLLALPGSGLDIEGVIEAVRRLARAVGARPGSYAVRLRVD